MTQLHVHYYEGDAPRRSAVRWIRMWKFADDHMSDRVSIWPWRITDTVALAPE